jgi:hypothetical protein
MKKPGSGETSVIHAARPKTPEGYDFIVAEVARAIFAAINPLQRRKGVDSAKKRPRRAPFVGLIRQVRTCSDVRRIF